VAAPTIVLAALLGALHADELWKLPFWLVGLNFVAPGLFKPLPGVAPQWWYVGLALQVYMVFPLLALLLRRVGLGWLVFGALSVNVTSILLIEQLPPAWQYLQMGFVGARMMEVVAGVFLWSIVSDGSGPIRSLPRALRLWAGLVGSFVVLALAQPAERTHWLFELSVVALVALVLWVPLPRRPYLGALKRAGDWGGRVSYPLYLCHYAVIALLLAALQRIGALSTGLLLLLGVSASLAVAAAFFYSLPLVWPRRRTPTTGETSERRA
jgi:peptidoglycan/LPS O-acetylase OafA/YrhL